MPPSAGQRVKVSVTDGRRLKKQQIVLVLQWSGSDEDITNLLPILYTDRFIHNSFKCKFCKQDSELLGFR